MSVLNSLFGGIDVSKNSNQVYAMNFGQKKLLSFSASNDSEGASKIEAKLIECLIKKITMNMH
ncbi:MAG: IS110 family transposase [Clostridium sp.]|nr:MAG: IS110 family transposase [Clostridium sp.]